MTHPSKKPMPETEQKPPASSSVENRQQSAPEKDTATASEPIFHIGWRIYKTGFAALICMLFSHALGGFPFFAVVAALISMKPTLEDSFNVGLHRVIGTIIGGMTGMVMLTLFQQLGWARNSFLYDLLTVIVMMVLIKFISVIGRNQATVITCVAYTSILLMPLIEGQSVVQYSMMRVVDTLLGVVVALVVNEVLPNNYSNQKKAEEVGAIGVEGERGDKDTALTDEQKRS